MEPEGFTPSATVAAVPINIFRRESSNVPGFCISEIPSNLKSEGQRRHCRMFHRSERLSAEDRLPVARITFRSHSGRKVRGSGGIGLRLEALKCACAALLSCSPAPASRARYAAVRARLRRSQDAGVAIFAGYVTVNGITNKEWPLNRGHFFRDARSRIARRNRHVML